MSYLFKEEDSHPRHKESRDVENVLVLQGGGSLGAFACGVFKALVKKNIRIDIAAGTSIGAVNAAIIVGSKSDHPEEDLEQFWIELAESSPMIIPDTFMFEYDSTARSYVTKKMSSASANAAIFGVPKMFVPRWRSWNWDKNILSRGEAKQGKIQQPQQQLPQYFFDPRSWTYLYDHSQLA